ncbi:MAG: hypothetical protein ACPL1Y_00035 [Thermoplasmata archaeon]
MEDLFKFARYPFLRGAAEYIKKENIELESLLSDEIYATARDLGIRRATSAITNPTQSYGFNPTEEISALNIILSYPVARMIISATRDKGAIARYAVSESKNFSIIANTEKPETLLEISSDLGISADFDRKFSVHFTDYLMYTSQFRGNPEWKLAHQDMERGYVFLSKEKFVRLLEEKLRRKIASELPLPVNEKIKSSFNAAIASIKDEIQKRRNAFHKEEMGSLNEEAFPPCMKKILAQIRNGENAPHMARFAIVAFLKGIGLGSEEILKLFASSPDFDIEKSRYQIEHITGKISGTTYKSPGCATMKSYGLCTPDENLCKQEWLKHPWVYYRKKNMELRKAKTS